MNNDAEVSIKFKNYVTGESKLKEYAQTLTKIQSVLASINEGKLKQIEQSKDTMKQVSNTAEKAAQKINVAFNYGVIKKFASALGNVYAGLIKVTQKSSEFLESFNLFQVAFNNNYQEAERFINKMAEMYGLDEGWLTRTVGLFKQLANAMGMTAEVGDKLSTLLTQMSVDISSLYNLDVDQVPAILQSALAGQTKPARRLGADITQTTLQQTLGGLGIDKEVVNLSYAEKRLLIVISLTKQLTQATGDWGRTLESPANQMRILNEQFSRLTREVGNVFLPILAKILPYLNAIVMVLTEIIATIARLFGFNKNDYDYFEVMADDIDDFGAGVDEASSSVEKLKRGLRGFDKLNNITTPTPSSASGGVAAGGGIDPKLMDAFNSSFDEYFKKLDSVEMKATKIRDRIMEWLGFQKHIDEKTKDVYFTFEKITSGTVLGALAVGGTIFVGITTILNMLKKFGAFTGISTAVKAIGGTISKMLGLGTLFEGLGVLFSGAGTFAEVFSVYFLPFLEQLGGVGVIIGGFIRSIQGINDLLDETKSKFDGIIKIVQGVALAVAGVAVLLGAWPVALGAAIVAAVAFLTQLVVDNWEKIKAFFVGIWEALNTTIIQPVVEWFSGIVAWLDENVFQPIIAFFTPIVEAIVMVFDKIVEIVAKIIEINVALAKALYEYVIKPIGQGIADIAKWINEKIIQPVVEWVTKAATWFYNTLIKPIAEFFKGVGTWIYNNVIKPIWDKVVWLKNKAIEIFKTIGVAIADFISGMIKGVINGIFSRIESSINGFIRLLNGAIGIINKIPGVDITKVSLLSLPRLEKGMDFVPNDYYGPVYLDYGERVLTKQENRDYMANKTTENARYNTNQGKQIYNIYLDQDHKIGTYTLEQLQDMAKSNGKPLTIGGA